MTIDNWIERHARYSPHKTALRFNAISMTYRELASAIDQTAALFASELKLQRGERVAIYATNHPEYFILLFAAARLGLILVPLNWRLSAAELNFIVKDCAPRALLYSAQFKDSIAEVTDAQTDIVGFCIDGGSADHATLDAARREVDRNAIAHDDPSSEPSARWPDASRDELAQPLLIVYTSGTTGRPKGAVLSQRAIVCNARMSQHAYDMSGQDHVLNVLPLFHVGGLNIQPLPALSLGATVTIHDKFDAGQTLAAIAADSISLITVVPTVMQALLSSPNWPDADVTSLRSIAIGSTDVPVDLIEQSQRRGIPVVQIYGATESAPIAIYQSATDAFAKAGSIGRCGLCCDIRLVNAAGDDVATNQHGEIWIKGDNILDFYWNNPRATRENIVDGWFRTGDVAKVDDNGDYWFVDRIKHVIISGGENIYPAELERILTRIPGVREGAVVGRRDDKWGTVPVAVVARQSTDLTPDQIMAAFEGNIASFKRPRDVVFVDALPRNALGKIIVADLERLV